VDPYRVITLTDAAVLAGCSRKSLERRVERGSIAVTLDDEGKRAVRVSDLLRALSATEAALRRARDEVAALRQRVMDAEARAAVAEGDLTTVLLGQEPGSRRPSRASRGRLRLRAT
jgi:predicted nucleotidyltransferase